MPTQARRPRRPSSTRRLGADVDPAHRRRRGATMRYSSSNGSRRPPRPPPSPPAPDPGRRAWMHARCASRVPANSSGSTPWIRWSSSLHCTAPVPTSHSHRPTWASASPPLRRASTSARVAWASRISVMSCVDRRRHRPRRRVVDHGADRQRDGDGHAVLAVDVGRRRARSGRRRPPTRSHVDRLAAHVRGNRARTGWPTISPPVSPKIRSALRFQAVIRPSASCSKRASAAASSNASSTATGAPRAEAARRPCPRATVLRSHRPRVTLQAA